MNEKLMRNSLAGAISTILAGAASLGTAPVAVAGAVACPNVGESTGCNLTITLNANGSATIANGTSPGTYDGSDDTLIGVINNTGHTVNSIYLSGLSGSSNTIFGFDGDGVTSSGLTVSLTLNGDTGPTHGSGYSGTDSTSGTYDLTGPLNSFSNISGNQYSGDVVFGSSGLASGGSAFFGLEEALNLASFTATTSVPSVPEPGSLGILSAGLVGLAGFGLLRRRQNKS